MSPELERLIGRAITNKEFRDTLLNDPEQAVKDGGFKLSDEELKQLKEGIGRLGKQSISSDLDQLFGAKAGGWNS